MTILGIETATTVCAAATVRDGTVIAEDSLDERYIHAERIMGFVEKAVTAAGGLHTIDAIAVSIGPGSFTGLRIGLSVAKGLAYAADLKIVAVPTLEAIAWRLLRAGAVAPGERILTVLPARRGEAFGAYYRVVGGAPEPESRRSPLVGRDSREGTLSGSPVRSPVRGLVERPVDAV
ncbi:MAG TPA: tRNA (adenosine(37)-N6)-threonylcarbamoyltransferase complex dimerization subunit type 1 TsaB, partial [Bacteroidota bacterium]